VESGRLAVLDVAELPARRRWFTVHRRGKRLPAVANAFIAFLAEEGAERIRQLVPPRLRHYWRE